MRLLSAWYSNMGRSMPALKSETEDLFKLSFLFFAVDEEDPVEISEVGHRFLIPGDGQELLMTMVLSWLEEMLEDLDRTAPLRALMFCYKGKQPEPLNEAEEEELYELINEGYLYQDEGDGSVTVPADIWLRIQKSLPAEKMYNPFTSSQRRLSSKHECYNAGVGAGRGASRRAKTNIGSGAPLCLWKQRS